MTRDVHLTTASDIEARKVQWLWPGYVPMGKVTVLAGAPGLGKSLLTIQLAARVSKLADVLIASAEDDLSDTIKPRLLAANADNRRVHLMAIEHGDRLGRGIVQLPGDAPGIHQAVKDLGARLVVLDPVAAFLDAKHSAISEQETRAALAPLAAMAEDTHAAVLLVMHLNKSDGSDPLRRIGNSGAFTALARMVLLFGTNPEDEDGSRGPGRILTVVKGNVRPPGRGSLAMRVVTRSVPVKGGSIDAPMLEDAGESNVSAEDLLASGEERSAKGEAMRFLRMVLADGALPSKEVYRLADEAGIAFKTVKRAKRDMGVKSEKDGIGGWTMRLHELPGPDGPLLVATEQEDWPSSAEDGLLGSNEAKKANEAVFPSKPLQGFGHTTFGTASNFEMSA